MMANERVGDMTLDELKAFIQQVVLEQFRNMGIIGEGEEELWTRKLEELTASELLLKERRRRELP